MPWQINREIRVAEVRAVWLPFETMFVVIVSIPEDRHASFRDRFLLGFVPLLLRTAGCPRAARHRSGTFARIVRRRNDRFGSRSRKNVARRSGAKRVVALD